MSDLKKLQQDALGWDWTVQLLAKRCKYTAGYNSAVRERDKQCNASRLPVPGLPPLNCMPPLSYSKEISGDSGGGAR